MSDTSPKVLELIARRYAETSPEERMGIASGMYEMARAIIESSLPDTLSNRDRRLAVARRLYNDELPEAALIAHADWQANSA